MASALASQGGAPFRVIPGINESGKGEKIRFRLMLLSRASDGKLMTDVRT
jgi:hypothetical protein